MNKNIIKSPILKTGLFLFFDFKRILFLIKALTNAEGISATIIK